jgi:tRNA dimethylallyltransferase
MIDPRMTAGRSGDPPSKPAVICIIGPTAVGKTELSIQLARRLHGEIISADSRLVYRGLDIGTAKPSLEERAGIPHYLIDVLDPWQTWSLALFQRAAAEAVFDIQSRHALPFLVGGTGQYLHALLNGWNPPPAQPDSRLREELQEQAKRVGAPELHARLAVLDPQAAQRIDPRNVRRTIRALEVILASGQKYSALRRQEEPAYRPFILGLTRPRPELYERVDARIEAMFAAGLLDEVQRLLERGCTPDMPSMSSIGYRECCLVLSGGISLEQAKKAMRRRSRIFIRRQANWFKLNDPSIAWFDAGHTPLEVFVTAVQEFLG